MSGEIWAKGGKAPSGRKPKTGNTQEFDPEFVDTEEDKANAAQEFFKKTKINARGRIHDFCDGMEMTAMLMLQDALRNKGGRARILDARQKLLNRLWKFRDEADCEDDFDQDEFHSEMRILAVIQRKLASLDLKIMNMMQGAEESSSDSDGDGERGELDKLKFARQNLRYALGQGSVPVA
jgi:hypothetical protein